MINLNQIKSKMIVTPYLAYIYAKVYTLNTDEDKSGQKALTVLELLKLSCAHQEAICKS